MLLLRCWGLHRVSWRLRARVWIRINSHICVNVWLNYSFVWVFNIDTVSCLRIQTRRSKHRMCNCLILIDQLSLQSFFRIFLFIDIKLWKIQINIRDTLNIWFLFLKFLFLARCFLFLARCCLKFGCIFNPNSFLRLQRNLVLNGLIPSFIEFLIIGHDWASLGFTPLIMIRELNVKELRSSKI